MGKKETTTLRVKTSEEREEIQKEEAAQKRQETGEKDDAMVMSRFFTLPLLPFDGVRLVCK